MQVYYLYVFIKIGYSCYISKRRFACIHFLFCIYFARSHTWHECTIREFFSPNKSELMYVSNRKPASLPVIHCNNMPLRWVDSLRYLGVNINSMNNRSKGLQLTCHQAKKAQSTYAHFISPNCFFKSYS